MFSVESKRSCSFSATPLHRGTVANLKVKVEMQTASSPCAPVSRDRYSDQRFKKTIILSCTQIEGQE